MKKALSLVLSFILAFSCFASVLTTTSFAETESVELISNGDFEDVTLNPVGANVSGISGTTNVQNLNDGKWHRATGGLSFATYGDLSNYDADTDTVTKAGANEYAKYFAPCTTVMAQPDDATNHVGRVNQTLFQAIDISEGTYTFKFKVRTNENVPYVVIYLRGLQNSMTDGTVKATDSFYDKFTIKVIDSLGNFTYDDNVLKGVKIIPNKKEEWTDVEILAKVEKVENPVSSNAKQTIIETDYTMLQIYHDSTALSTGDNGKNYRKQGIYIDNISVKAANAGLVECIGDTEIYVGGTKQELCNENVTVTALVNGNATSTIYVGDAVTTKLEYNADILTFSGWYKNGEFLSKDEVIAFTANASDLYVPRFANKNLFVSGSFEGYDLATSLEVTDNTKFPNEGEWGISSTKGYYAATQDGTIYDKYGFAYQQTANNNTPSAVSTTRATVVSGVANSGSKSLLLKNAYHTLMTALDLETNTDYTVSYYVLANSDTKMKYSGVSTTVNVAYQKEVTPLDGGTSASGMTVALGNMGDAYAISKKASIDVSASKWTKVTHTFNSGNFEKAYLCICPSAGEQYWLDDITLTKDEVLPTVDIKYVDGEGNQLSNEEISNISAKAVIETEEATGKNFVNVSYLDGAYTFLGWFNADDQLVSDAERFEINKETGDLYAKISSINLLTHASSFEGYIAGTELKYNGPGYPTNEQWGGNKNAGYLGATFAETIYDKNGNAIEQVAGGTAGSNGISVKAVTDKAHSGDKSLNIKNNYWTASSPIAVKPNTDYSLSYYILAPERVQGKNNTIVLSAIATSLNTGTSSKVSGGNTPLNQNTALYLTSEDITSVHDGENWVKVTHSFNSKNLSTVYLVLGQSADTTAAGCWAYLDDMTMIETTPATAEVKIKSCGDVEFLGTDIDKLYIGQKVDFKVIASVDTLPTVTVNNAVINPNADGTYSFKAVAENNISVRFAGDENLPWCDEDELGRKLNQNNHAVYSEPVWSGDTVYHETALFTPDKDTVKLLYPVDSIVSLRSYDLKTHYIEGYDYEITEDGQIKRLEGGRIPVWATSLISDTDNGWKTSDGRFVVLTGDATYPKYAVSITYKHSKTFEGGYQPAAPESQAKALNNVLAKLKNGEEVNIVVYGDSISCGWSSSGMNYGIKIYDETNTEGNYITRYNIDVAPYAPTWVQMFETQLNALYPDAEINLKNLSLGGKSSPWGATNIAPRLALWKDEAGNQVTPDLMLVGFGVNDSAANVTTANFKTNIENIIKNARNASGNANMEVLLYSPMFPNQAAVNWPAERLLAYESAMEEITLADQNVGLMKLSTIFSEIIKNKACEDYLNTNLNHGNDFTARLYYNGIMAAMEPAEEVAPALPSGDEIFENLGNSIRKDGEVKDKPQALRFKLGISKKVLDASYDGYTVSEYGAVVSRNGKFGDALTLDSANAIKGVAYSSADGTELLFDKNDTHNVYTMALYGMGYNAATNTTDYTMWGEKFAVRGYAVFSAEGKEDIIVYADETVTCSVFDVMKAIENGDNADDKAYVENLLSKSADLKAAYDAWKA